MGFNRSLVEQWRRCCLEGLYWLFIGKNGRPIHGAIPYRCHRNPYLKAVCLCSLFSCLYASIVSNKSSRYEDGDSLQQFFFFPVCWVCICVEQNDVFFLTWYGCQLYLNCCLFGSHSLCLDCLDLEFDERFVKSKLMK